MASPPPTNDPSLGYPGMEDFDPDWFIDMKCFCQVAFRALGYSWGRGDDPWQHPRIQEFLLKVSEKMQRPIPDQHRLPIFYYRLLATKLAQELHDPSVAWGQEVEMARGLLRQLDKRVLVAAKEE